LDNKLYARRIFIIVGIGILLISAELLAFRSLNHAMDGFARGMGTLFQRATVVVDVVSAASKLTPQGLATIASVGDLSNNPRKFDGRLVRVRAWLAFGWEGDNFLVDSSEAEPSNMHSHRAPRVWFYSRSDRERQVWDAVNFGGPPVLGTFTGYFHFVPDPKSRMNGMFDPGPLQLEVIGVSDLGSQTKPDRMGSATR
jgi:hypothetical protein